MDDYDKAIALNPNDALAYNNRGVAYSNKGEVNRAIADYRKALEIDPYYSTPKTTSNVWACHFEQEMRRKCWS